MAAIARLPRLRHLSCQDPNASDAGFSALAKSASIERALSVSCQNVSDDGTAALPSFPALRDVMPMDVPDEGYRHIWRCGELEWLTLVYCDTSDRATELIAPLPKLRKYFASYTKITDRTPEILSRMHSLEEIEISGCPGVTDAGMARLARLPRLRNVSVSGQNVSSAVGETFPPGVRVRYHL
jgi:hypothetical protein